MSVVLALYPNTRGLCYACLHMPEVLIDCGIANPLPFSVDRYLKRVERFLDYYSPQVIVLRGLAPNTFRGKQAEKLIQSISELAVNRGLPIHHYTRRQIRDVFEVYGAKSKYAISQEVINRLPELSHLAPKPRKLWLPEDPHMGIIDAVSLAITHEHLNE